MSGHNGLHRGSLQCLIDGSRSPEPTPEQFTGSTAEAFVLRYFTCAGPTRITSGLTLLSKVCAAFPTYPENILAAELTRAIEALVKERKIRIKGGFCLATLEISSNR